METLTAEQPNVIALQSLTDQLTNTVVTTATVTHTLYDADGAIVTGETARACPHTSGGNYQATIPSTCPLVPGSAYRGIYAVTVGPEALEFSVQYLAAGPHIT
jgi:hypothetical protein